MINKTLAILAGGKNSRMNYNNKALLIYKDKKFIEYIIKAGRDYKEIIIVSNNPMHYKTLNLRVVSDIYKGNGPLSGIHSALVNSENDEVLCIACDMPFISQEVLNLLGNYKGKYEVLVPEINKILQPMCAIYSKGIIKAIEIAIKENNNKLQGLIKSLNCEIITEEYSEELAIDKFVNINTVKEYEGLI